ncbi:hypothetical protein Trydic_g9623 [Trypoxylus dichotomus]
MTNVSSTYLRQTIGLSTAVSIARLSNCSTKRLATTGLNGLPIATPSVCLKRFVISGGNRSPMYRSVSTSGTLVNSDTTSKLTGISPGLDRIFRSFSTKSVPKEEIIANVEAAIRRLPASEGDAVRIDVTRILRTAKPQKSNISPAEWKALKQLKQDESLTIIQADKDDEFCCWY